MGTIRRLSCGLSTFAAALALPGAVLGQTPPEPPAAVPVLHRSAPASMPPIPTSLNEVKHKFGVWDGDKFIPIGSNGMPIASQDQNYVIDLEPPSREKLYTLRGEAGLKRFIEEELRRIDPATKPSFPPTVQLVPPGVKFTSRQHPPSATEVVPGFLCHQPLYFEEKNSERYGWEMGIWQPFLSAGTFYKDLVFLPYKMGTQHPASCVTNVGKCLPGDCVPYTLYVSPFSWKGVATETAAVVGGAIIWP